jgi:xanthosine utilization system XapX-like protein
VSARTVTIGGVAVGCWTVGVLLGRYAPPLLAILGVLALLLTCATCYVQGQVDEIRRDERRVKTMLDRWSA